MLKPFSYDCLISQEKILTLKAYHDQIYLLTKYNFYSIYPKKRCEIIKLQSFQKEILFGSISLSGKFLGCIFNDALVLYDITNKEILSLYDGEYIWCGFYYEMFVAITKTNRVVICSKNTQLRLFSLPKDASLKSCIIQEDYLFCSCDDGSFYQFSFEVCEVIYKKFTTVVSSVYRINNDSVFLGFVSGDGAFFDFSKQLKKEIVLPFYQSIRTILKYKNYLLIIAKEGNSIAVVEKNEQKLFLAKYIEFEMEIIALELFEDFCIVVLASNRVVFVSLESIILQQLQKHKKDRTLFIEKQNLQELVEKKRYAKAWLLVQKYPILKNEKEYGILKEEFLHLLQKVLKLLRVNKKQQALHLVNEYMIVPQKKEIISLLFRLKEVVLVFLKALENEELPLCNELIQKHPALQYSSFYKIFLEKLQRKRKKFKEILNRRDFSKEEYQLLATYQWDRECKQLYNVAKKLNQIKNNTIDQQYQILASMQECYLKDVVQKKVSQDIFKSFLLAKDGKFQKCYDSLQLYLHIKKKQKVASCIFRLAFLELLWQLLLQKKYLTIEQLFYQYIDFFGNDLESIIFAKAYQKQTNKVLAIDSSLQWRVDRWIDYID